MKSVPVCCLFLFLLLSSPLQSQIDPDHAFLHRYQGTIAGKYPVVLNLVAWGGGELSGWYYYKRVGTRIELSGNFTEGKHFELKEYSGHDHTGTFLGRMLADTTLEGLWIDDRGKQRLSFALSKVPTLPDPVGWAGNWYLNEAWDDALLLIGHVTRDSFDFALSVMRHGHLGMLEGTAAHDGNTATFTGLDFATEPCHLDFKRRDSSVYIEQHTGSLACGFGMRAHANGRYETERREVPPEFSYGSPRDLFQTPGQRETFRQMLGDEWYKEVAFNMQGTHQMETIPAGAPHLTAVEGAAIGFTGTRQAIVLHRDHNQYWILSLGYEEEEGTVLHYLTNVEADLGRLPAPLEKWARPFMDFPLRRFLVGK